MRASEIILGQGYSKEVIENVVSNTLNPKLWEIESDPPSIKTGVRKQLMQVVSEFIKSVDVYKIRPVDIVLTGSNANFNWNSESDIDLHILVDFSKVKGTKGLIEKFFHDLALMWNEHHDITIYGHEVELYIQDIKEPHYASGVYSLKNKSWNSSPTMVSEPDVTQAHELAHAIATKIDELSRIIDLGSSDESILKAIDYMRDHIRDLRKHGLKAVGEYSKENIAFKILRKAGYLEKLRDLSRSTYDSYRSIYESKYEEEFLAGLIRD